MYKKSTLYSILIALFLALSGCGGTSNVIPPAKLIKFKPLVIVKESWSKGVGDGEDGEYLSFSPVLRNGILYTAGYNGEVTAVNSRNGKEIWSSDLDLKLSSTPLVTDEHVYVGSMFGKLAKLDINTGKLDKLNNSEKDWIINVPSSVFSAPVFYEGSIVLNTLNGEVSAYDSSTGKLKWSQVVGTPPLMLTGNSSPIISNSGKRVYIGMDNGELWALNLETGNKLWDIPIAIPEGGSDISRMVDIVGTPIEENGIIYVASYQGNVAAINSENGAIIWKKKMSTYGSIAISYDTIYITNSESYVIALDKSNGSMKWQQKILEGRGVTAPVVVHDYITVSDFEGYMHFFKQTTGKYSARIKIGGDGISSQAISNGNIAYVQTNNGTLAAVRINIH
ncbi:MAG: outer membrane protein assembly factor BamB [Francisellaceae bacterium]|jgi:outer membrane protein assembly factor BamB